MASLKCQLESLAATMQSYKQKHKHNYLFYSPHMRHEHFANWYTPRSLPATPLNTYIIAESVAKENGHQAGSK